MTDLNDRLSGITTMSQITPRSSTAPPSHPNIVTQCRADTTQVYKPTGDVTKATFIILYRLCVRAILSQASRAPLGFTVLMAQPIKRQLNTVSDTEI